MSEYVGIEREIIELILQRKFFYGHFLQQFKRHTVNKSTAEGKIIGTLAVNITSDLRPNLYINTDFYNSGDYDSENPTKQTWGLTPEEKLGLLEHEILHILNKHLIRIDNRDSYVWNVATDIAINQYIKGLPEGAMCPDCGIFVRNINSAFPKNCPLCKIELDEKINKCKPLALNDIKIKDTDVKLDPNNPSETYYDIIWKKFPKKIILMGKGITNSREKEAIDGLKDSGDGEGKEGKDGQGGGSQEGSMRGVGTGMIEIDGEQIPISIDNHETWRAGTDNKEMAHHKIKDMVQNTMDRVNQKSQGHLPSHVRSLIDAVLAHKTISWKSELRKFVGYEEFSNFKTSRKRINRRFPIVQPGYLVERKAHFVVAIDSSGSISDVEFGKFFKEIGMMHAAKLSITYVECDADIQLVEEYRRKPKVAQHKRVGYGGTDIRPVFDFVKNKHYKNHRGQEFKIRGKVDGLIYLTDGYGSYPDPKDLICPVIWVYTPNHSDYGYGRQPDGKLGKKIVMDKD